MLAIHNGEGVNKRCIEYCVKNNIEHIVVDAYSPEIIPYLKSQNVKSFFWHFQHILPEDLLMARHILYSLELIGIKVYPNFDTSWYFDDKVAEKYVLEVIDAPIVESWAFYHKDKAIQWIDNCSTFPLVAKLRRGAGSYNVILLKNKREALKYINRMFGRGISPIPNIFSDAKSKFLVAKRKNNIISQLKKIPRFYQVMRYAASQFSNERGYVYFQKFIEGAKCDYRINIVGDKAWGCIRYVRDNDFRASGAGLSKEDPSLIPTDLVKMSFDIADKLNAQSLAFDYVFDSQGNPYIVEISYGFGFDGDDGTFYWSKNDLKLHRSKFTLEALLLESIL